MIRVHRFPLESGENLVVMPRGARILSAAFILVRSRCNGYLTHELCLWAACPEVKPDPAKPLAHYEDRKVLVVTDRAKVPDPVRYVSTGIVNDARWGKGITAWHVFEVLQESEAAE